MRRLTDKPRSAMARVMGRSASELDAVLAANRRFYDAFTNRDLDQLDALWARRHPVACVHPGWPALHGRDEVMLSWRNILTGPSSPQIACSAARGEIVGDVAYVTCTETLANGRLIATNLFVREEGEWRMIHHQAGALSPAFESEDPEPDETLH